MLWALIICICIFAKQYSFKGENIISLLLLKQAN